MVGKYKVKRASEAVKGLQIHKRLMLSFSFCSRIVWPLHENALHVP